MENATPDTPDSPDKTVYHVILENERWHVTVDDGGRRWGDFPSKEDAVREARMLADTTMPSEVLVHGPDGSVVNEYRHRPKPARHK